MNWKLNEASELFDMRNAPFAETKVAPDTKDEVAINERKYLQGILDQLNPAGGIVDDGDGTGRHANRDAKKKKKADKAAGKKTSSESDSNSSENANASGE